MLRTVQRVKLDNMDIGLGKRVRLHRLLYEHGPGRGVLLLLPIDQGLEHGPVDFFPNPDSADPEFQFRLALEGGFSGIALHVGLAEKYLRHYAGKVPVVLKLNGRTAIPSDAEAFSPLTGTVEDAVRLGADAVGYTLYVGSPSQAEDILQFNSVREEAERYGLPVIMWAYPRGSAIDAKGGRDSLYAVDYAARVACELGADVVKLNYPKVGSSDGSAVPKPYAELQPSLADGVGRVVRSAGRTLVLFAGGSKVGDEDLLAKASAAMEAGATGLIFGRNVWQRPYTEAVAITGRIREMMSRFGD